MSQECPSCSKRFKVQFLNDTKRSARCAVMKRLDVIRHPSASRSSLVASCLHIDEFEYATLNRVTILVPGRHLNFQ